MATISVTVTASQATRVTAAAAAVGYPATNAGVTQWITDWLKESVLSIEKREAEAAVAAPADFV